MYVHRYKNPIKILNMALLAAFIILQVAHLFLYKLFFITITVGVVASVGIMFVSTSGRVFWPKKSNAVIFFYCVPFISAVWSLTPLHTLYSAFIFCIGIVIFYAARLSCRGGKFKIIKDIVSAVPIANTVVVLALVVEFGSLRLTSAAQPGADLVGSLSNSIAAAMIMSIPFIMCFRRDGSYGRFHASVLFLSAAGIILLSQSRAAYVLAPLAIILTLVVSPGQVSSKVVKLYTYIIVAVVVLIIVSTLTTYPADTWERFQQSQVMDLSFLTSSDPELPDYGRAAMYTYGIMMVAQNPIMGVGYAGLKSFMEDRVGFGLVSHNIIITYWGGMGMLGLLAVIWLFAHTSLFLLRILRDRRRDIRERNISAACVVSLIIIFIYSMVRPIESNFMFPLILGCAYSLKQRPLRYMRIASSYQVNHEASDIGNPRELARVKGGGSRTLNKGVYGTESWYTD